MTVRDIPLAPAEQFILERLGGRRWTTKRYTRATVKAAQDRWVRIRKAADFAGKEGWLTTEKTNPKLGKSGIPSVGVTIHSATVAIGFWKTLPAETQAAYAEALDVTVEEIERGLARTVCPRSTVACRTACVVAHSVNGENVLSMRARLARHLFLMFHPAEAFTMTAEHLAQLRRDHGVRGARWRVCINDDLRWELLAPGLFTIAPRPYSYTKWTPAERPGRPGFRLVYSASERTTDLDIIRWTAQGHRVAVVFDVKKGQPLPDTWWDIPVVDGDLTDDLWSHPDGCIVGLRAKGRTAAKELMRTRGFARPAVPVTIRTQQEPLAA